MLNAGYRIIAASGQVVCPRWVRRAGGYCGYKSTRELHIIIRFGNLGEPFMLVSFFQQSRFDGRGGRGTGHGAQTSSFATVFSAKAGHQLYCLQSSRFRSSPAREITLDAVYLGAISRRYRICASLV
jgi:hypothetical protein